ncbi:MAG: hypothetical protein GKS06_19875 [Acidobacteria bacterium]|nr:hypothetical protein [Acidobacteriota bacterium]
MNSDVRRTLDSGQKYRWKAELADLANLADDACGIDVRALHAGQILAVKTHYTTYRMQITDPQQGRAIVEGDGSFLTTPTDATIIGATLSGRGSSVANGRVLTGFRLVIAADEGEIITSRVRAVSVDGMPWFSEFHEA